MRVPAVSYVGRWPRAGVLTVTADGLGFETSRTERWLRAEPVRVPAGDVQAVEPEPRSLRRPTTWGVHRVLLVTTRSRSAPLRIGVNHGAQVAAVVPALLKGDADDREVRRAERKAREQFPTWLLWMYVLGMSLWLLRHFGPALLRDDQPIGTGRIVLGVVVALLLACSLSVLLWRGIERVPG